MIKLLQILAILAVIAGSGILVARWAFPLPDIAGRATEAAIPASDANVLGRLMAEGASAHPGLSGVIPLRNGHDALASRLALIEAARVSIDTQYYIWHDDTSGILLLDALHKAAARGVRVRLLLDDNGITGLDPTIAALNRQKNFSVRLFNPSTIRSPKYAGYTFDFLRMNRRMHNKSLIVDGAAAIIGGRNIGDEYFQVGAEAFYVDMDVMATGPVVPRTAAVFDAYWNSASVFDVAQVIAGAGDLPAFEARAAEVRDSEATHRLLDGFRADAGLYAERAAEMEWTTVQVVADDPVKGQGIATPDQLMITRLGDIMGTIERRFDVVSAYFVPGPKGTQVFTDLARAGKDVRVLTNALNTTDVLMVHAGYARYRRELLEAGVKLYELKLRGGMASEKTFQSNPFGLSGASLHAKTFAVDDARVFIGSFNFDPRSATLNCEMGFLIDSPGIANQVSRGFEERLDQISYRPMLTPEGKMVWRELEPDGSTTIYQEEPGATWVQQISLAVIGVLPVEWLL